MRFEYELRRSARRTLAIEVREDGSVLVRAPRNCPKERIEDFLSRKQAWMEEKVSLQKKRKQCAKEIQPLSEAQARLYRESAREIFRAKAEYYSGVMGVTFGRIAVRDQKTRWGSCSARGNLNFNWRLILAPAGVLDYVVVHELAHRREMNHSARFWAVVEKAMPDYRKYKKWLAENGRNLRSF